MIESFPARSEACQNSEGPPRTPWRDSFVGKEGNRGLGGAWGEKKLVCESPWEDSGVVSDYFFKAAWRNAWMNSYDRLLLKWILGQKDIYSHNFLDSHFWGCQDKALIFFAGLLILSFPVPLLFIFSPRISSSPSSSSFLFPSPASSER